MVDDDSGGGLPTGEPLLCYPDPLPPGLASALDAAGYGWRAVGGTWDVSRLEPADGAETEKDAE